VGDVLIAGPTRGPAAAGSAGAPRVHLLAAAGPTDGQGHLARQLSLAEALVAQGASVSLELVRGAPTPGQAARLAALGVRVGGPAEAEACVVDLPDPNLVRSRVSADRTAVFDDREWFGGEAGLVLQPSMPVWSGSATTARRLAGYAFAPVSAAVRAAALRPPRGDGARVVVCFGGSDPEDVTGRVAPGIARALDGVVVVIGPSYAGTCRPGAGLEVLRNPDDLYPRLRAASLAVIASGTMKFEVAHLGTPALMLAVADDQVPVGPPFTSTGAARYVGDGRTLDPDVVADAAVALLSDGPALAEMRRLGPQAVDGLGGERVARAVLELARPGSAADA